MAPVLRIGKSGKRNAPTLPLEAVTRTFGIFGQRGTGKTTTARVLAEEMARKGGHVVVFDPVGAWYGITRNGEGRGIPGVVMGGEHGDVPLEETGGALVADLIVERHWPVVVVDMKLMRKGAQRRFLADCLEDVFQKCRAPLHVVFEEADRVFPQTPRGMDPILGRVIGAGEDIVKLGRSRGLGATIVSQRFASVQKNVTEQTETLVLHRFMGPRDRKAASEWIESNGDPRATTKVLDSLASLQVGEAWLYSPGWLGVLEQIRVKTPQTFDSSATPEVGAAPIEETAPRAKVDLDELGQRMAATVERAKANDPKELRKRIVALERDLKAAQEDQPEAREIDVEIEVMVPEPAAVESLHAIVANAHTHREALENLQREAGEHIARMEAVMVKVPRERQRVERAPVERPGAARVTPAAPQAPAVPRAAPSRPAGDPDSNGHDDGRLTRKAERVVLSVLAQWPDGLEKKKLALLSGYSHTSGGFGNALGRLRKLGYITPGFPVRATQEGLTELGEVEPLPEGRDLIEWWMRQLNRAAERTVLDVALGAWPDALTREEVAERAGYSATSGGFGNALGKLRRLDLISPGPDIRAADELGEAALRS